MSNFYKGFGCKDKKELYKKVIAKDASVQTLIDFIEFSQTQIINDHQGIRSPDHLFRYVENISIPTKENAVFVFVDTKNHPVHQRRTKINQKEEIKKSLSEGLEAGGVSMFTLVDSSANEADIKFYTNLYKNIGIETIDQLTYKEERQSYYSEKGAEHFQLNNPHSKVNENNHEKDYGYEQLLRNDEVKEFTTYFANNELMQKNIIEDRKEIKDALKVGYQFYDQEVFGFIAYDQEHKVIAVKDLFKGGSNMSVVDHKILTKEVLKLEGLKGYAVYHNHPSGVSTQSTEDELVTKRIRKINEGLGIELLDHYIVGKQNVLSFAEDLDWFKSDSAAYEEQISKDNEIASKRQSGRYMER